MLGVDDLLHILNGVSPSGAILGTAVAFFGYMSAAGIKAPDVAAGAVMIFGFALIYNAVIHGLSQM